MVGVTLMMSTGNHAAAAAHVAKNTTQPVRSAAQTPAWEPLADEVGKLLATTNNPQAALIIVADGAIALHRDYPRDRPEQKQKEDSDNNSETGSAPFRLGSITKLFTALTLLHASAATDTPLDTPLANIVDKTLWQNPWRDTHPVRLDQLIELSAGFADISATEFASAKPLPRLQALALDPDSHTTHWPPGLQHSYTNLAPAYSALAVEALTGQSFASYLSRNVLQPLGMPDATLQPLPDLPGGFQADGITPIPYWHTIYPAFGGLNATPNQFANLLLRMTQHDFGSTLNAAIKRRSANRLWQPTTTAAAREGLTLGYGAGVYATIRRGHLVYGHGGDADGYRSRFGVINNSTRGYFLAINSDNPGLLRRLQAVVERRLVADLPKPVPPAAQAIEPEHTHMQRFIGDYYPSSQRFGLKNWHQGQGKTAQIRKTGKHLEMQHGNRKTRLLWLGGNLFKRANDPVATLAFVEADNRIYLQGELGNWLKLSSPRPSP